MSSPASATGAGVEETLTYTVSLAVQLVAKSVTVRTSISFPSETNIGSAEVGFNKLVLGDQEYEYPEVAGEPI